MNNTRILLSSPDGPVNLGFIARAMANTGFTNLSYTGRLKQDNPTALKYALAAGNILADARHAADFDDLISQSDKVVAISMRTPESQGIKIRLSELKQYITDAAAIGLTTGLLFGNERTGLHNDELSKCSAFLSLDTSDVFPSMNLAQAVLVVMWEIKDTEPVTINPQEYADRTMIKTLTEKTRQFADTFHCLNQQNPDKIFSEIETAIASKNITAREAQIMLSFMGKAMAEYKHLLNK